MNLCAQNAHVLPPHNGDGSSNSEDPNAILSFISRLNAQSHLSAKIYIFHRKIAIYQGSPKSQYLTSKARIYRYVSRFRPGRFDYGNGTEATHGFTNYVTKDGAEWSNLTYATSNEAIIRVLPRDHTGATGRPTVKILSKQRYTHGLFIFDIGHVPYGCGTWPAIWMSDTDPDIWPSHGEIDIIESVNQGNKGTQFTLHTTNGCEMSVKRKQTGKVLSNNCLNSTNYNMGCAVRGTPDSYGEELNKNQGGVYAMEWRTAVILPEVADMQLRLCEDRRTEDDCQYQEFDLESLGYPWPQNILSFREVFPAYHPQKAVEANSLPSWDIESVFEGTGKPGFIDTDGWDTENAIDLSNLRLDDPLTLNGPEFLYEAIEGLE
ncbi:hypothetical protein TWF106_001216 [Orbilia oligospora]|uniref:GH16 domain-containing protein n=1 Tax=Orbilia oligospora TaxID=2813651 RepID=A0A7C8QB45_ORBOL|nr:hypothetical protein TWF106_001216 [Orbilia oligospora]